jgi:uncharacterized membrane protein HdeD (DUF308 family)
MSNNNKRTNKLISLPTILVVIGFILNISTSFFDLHLSTTVRNAAIILGIILIIVGVILSRHNSNFLDKKQNTEWKDILGFDLFDLYRDYRKIMNTKEKLMYSEWKENTLKEYNKFDETNSDKKTINDDIQYYLKELKRSSEEKIELFKTILLPADFGIIAAVVELDIAPFNGDMGFAIVMLISIVMCLFFAVEINSANKVIKFVDDFCNVLDIPV